MALVDSESIRLSNQQILKREIEFNKIGKDPNLEDVVFPELIYSAEISENLKIYETEFDLHQLQETEFFVNLIFDNYYKIKTKKYTGDVILFLYTKPLSFLNVIISKLGYGITCCDHENAITLLYYSLYLGISIDIDLKLRNFLVINTTETILSVYNKEFPSDRASIFYAFFNKCDLSKIKDYTKSDRYHQLLNVHYHDIYRKCSFVYPANKGLLSPIRYLCSIPFSPLETILSYTNEDILNFLQTIEYVPIELISYRDHRFYNFSEKAKFLESLYSRIKHNGKIIISNFLKQLWMYKSVILKDNTSINGKTDLELINYYKPDLNYSNRLELVNYINKYNTQKHWRYNFPLHCVNNISIITGEARTHCSEDALLCYGTLREYYQYNISELIGSFKTGKLLKPDAKNTNDVFPYTDMKSLIQILDINNSIEKELIELINLRLSEVDNIKNRIQILKDMDNNNKNEVVLNYFLAGLYAKYWKGPGHEYPLIWKDKKDDTTDDMYADYTSREVNCNNIFKQILENKDDFCKLLPRISYNWKTGDYSFGIESLYDITNSAYSGKFCISDYSTIALQSVYMYCKLILNIDINILIWKKYPEHKFEFKTEKIVDSTHIDYSLNFKEFS